MSLGRLCATSTKALAAHSLVLTLVLLAASTLSPPRIEAAEPPFLLAPEQSCSSGVVRANFLWRNAGETPVHQWLDLSIHNNGWVEGTYIRSESITGGTLSYAWAGLEPRTLHLVRLVLQYAEGPPVASGSIVFTTPGCGQAILVQREPGGQVFIHGFSVAESVSRDELVASGGTLRVCDSQSTLFLYAYIDASDFATRVTALINPGPRWFLDSTPLGQARSSSENVPGVGYRLAFPVLAMPRRDGIITLQLGGALGIPQTEATVRLTC
jgi:hypothetical protein